MSGAIPERSDRTSYVTEWVTQWIISDAHYVVRACRKYRDGGLPALASYIQSVLRVARYGSPPWQVRQELAPNDYDRIAWAEVAEWVEMAAELPADNEGNGLVSDKTVVARIVDLARLQNSTDGNPRYRVTTTKGVFDTKPDAAINYSVPNPEFRDVDVTFMLNGKNHIVTAEVGDGAS